MENLIHVVLPYLASPSQGQLRGSLPAAKPPPSVAGDTSVVAVAVAGPPLPPLSHPFLPPPFPSFLSHSTTPPVTDAPTAAFLPGFGRWPASSLPPAAPSATSSSLPSLPSPPHGHPETLDLDRGQSQPQPTSVGVWPAGVGVGHRWPQHLWPRLVP